MRKRSVERIYGNSAVGKYNDFYFLLSKKLHITFLLFIIYNMSIFCKLFLHFIPTLLFADLRI